MWYDETGVRGMEKSTNIFFNIITIILSLAALAISIIAIIDSHNSAEMQSGLSNEQNDIAETGNNLAETQNEIMMRQNEIMENQNDIMKQQNEIVENQARIDALQYEPNYKFEFTSRELYDRYSDDPLDEYSFNEQYNYTINNVGSEVLSETFHYQPIFYVNNIITGEKRYGEVVANAYQSHHTEITYYVDVNSDLMDNLKLYFTDYRPDLDVDIYSDKFILDGYVNDLRSGNIFTFGIAFMIRADYTTLIEEEKTKYFICYDPQYYDIVFLPQMDYEKPYIESVIDLSYWFYEDGTPVEYNLKEKFDYLFFAGEKEPWGIETAPDDEVEPEPEPELEY
jgi:hypothetical protein